MNLTFLTGLLGSLLLVCGAAYPDRPVSHPLKSVKDWLFALGGLVMFLYAFRNYQAGGQIFFVLLEALVVISSIFMMLNTPDTIDTPIILLAGLGFVVWSLFLFQDYSTLFFIVGLCAIGIGYVLKSGTRKREIVLMLGSALIALFSYLGASWIFFWLNVFFALFSGYYVWKMSGETRSTSPISLRR